MLTIFLFLLSNPHIEAISSPGIPAICCCLTQFRKRRFSSLWNRIDRVPCSLIQSYYNFGGTGISFESSALQYKTNTIVPLTLKSLQAIAVRGTFPLPLLFLQGGVLGKLRKISQIIERQCLYMGRPRWKLRVRVRVYCNRNRHSIIRSQDLFVSVGLTQGQLFHPSSQMQ